MPSLDRIMVATDFTRAADEAIRQGAERARDAQAELIVCHVIPTATNVDPIFVQYHQQVAEQLPELRNRLQSELTRRAGDAGIASDRCHVLIEEGTPHAVIVEKAEALQAGLIVLGPPANSGLTRLLFSSVADQVVRHAHCPVLIARPRSGSNAVLVATDLSDPALPAVSAAAAEVRRSGAPLTIVHSVEPVWPVVPYEAFGLGATTVMFSADLTETLHRQLHERLAAALTQAGTTGERVVVDGPAAQSILQLAEDRHCDLIVMGTVGRTGLKRAMLGSVAAAVTRHAPCSVLVVRLHPS